jgi:hypothetical protein
MKKTILTAVIIAFLATFVKAQDAQDPSLFHFGIKAGANYSNVYDINGEEFTADYKFGFAGGIFFAVPLGNYFGIQPEVLFSQKGYESNGSILGSAYKITRTSNYIDVPILLQIKPASFITVAIGPEYSYLISHKNSFSNSVISAQQQQDFDNINIRKNVLSLLGGLDFNIQNLVIGTRVGWDLLHNNGDGTSTSPRYRNMWYQATLGIRF